MLKNLSLEEELAALKAENFQLRNIINHLPGNIYWKNKAGVYLGRNATAAATMRGMNFGDEMVGKTDYDLFEKDMADGYRKNDCEVMETGREVIEEEIALLPDGNKRVQLSTKHALYNEKGEIAGVIGSTVDITYLKTIETELRQAKEKAERANVMKTEFIRNIEHDIRTPFSGVLGLAKQLSQKENDPLKKELLDDIAQCAKELLDYCNGILDFSKIESGRVASFEETLNLKKLIHNVLKIETPPAKLKKLTVKLAYDETIPPCLLGDTYRLESILINLMSNAIKFTHEGFVKLTVQWVKTTLSKQAVICFIVEDTGIGIPTARQDVIFDKFSRLIPSNKGLYKGIGLGLRIVKQFLNEMQGAITVHSVEGKGSQFIFTLPLQLF